MNEQPNTTITPLVYNGEVIHQRDEMLSLTDMWKSAGRDPQQTPAKWRDLPATISFVEHAELTIGKSDSLFSVKEGRGGGTWAHWQVALAYAKYLSPEFHMWCNQVVRDRMEGKASLATRSLSAKDTASTFKAYFSIGRTIGLDRNQAAIAANHATRKTIGVDPLGNMGATHLIAPQQEKFLTPTDIGVELGGKSGMAVNGLLAERGYQSGKRDAKDRPYWEPTEAGSPFAVWQDTGKRHGDGTAVRQLKWTADIVTKLAVPLEEGAAS